MNTTSIANVDDNDTVTAIATNTLSNGTDDAERTITSPFFSLPRELRDEIYALAALDEQTLYCEITLTADGPSQKTAHAYCGARRTFPNSQYEVEYSAAIERRVKNLVTGRDRNGSYLSGPGPVAGVSRDGKHAKAEEIWLEVSDGQQDDGQIKRNIHALMLEIPVWPCRHPRVCNNSGMPISYDPSVVFAFKFPEQAALGPRRRFDCYWNADMERRAEILLFPSDDGSVSQQVLSIAKEVNWKGSVREYMMWQRYVVEYARRGIA